MHAKLVVVGGDAKAAEIRLKLPTVIGRGRDASLTLPHPLVSRQHCEIFESEGQLMVRDLGSLNGTYINNQRITEAVLPSGDLLTIGTVTFRAVYSDSTDQLPPAKARSSEPASDANQTLSRPKEVTLPEPDPALDVGDEDQAIDPDNVAAEFPVHDIETPPPDASSEDVEIDEFVAIEQLGEIEVKAIETSNHREDEDEEAGEGEQEKDAPEQGDDDDALNSFLHGLR
jgi:pSer/pThr/pTyr-binding forkhead associated (FHA) protein